MREINPLDALQQFVDEHGTQRAAAKALDVTAPFLNMVLNGKREIPETMLGKLGLQRDVVFTRRNGRKS